MSDGEKKGEGGKDDCLGRRKREEMAPATRPLPLAAAVESGAARVTAEVAVEGRDEGVGGTCYQLLDSRR